jgi:hypothetical protein
MPMKGVSRQRDHHVCPCDEPIPVLPVNYLLQPQSSPEYIDETLFSPFAVLFEFSL